MRDKFWGWCETHTLQIWCATIVLLQVLAMIMATSLSSLWKIDLASAVAILVVLRLMQYRHVNFLLVGALLFVATVFFILSFSAFTIHPLRFKDSIGWALAAIVPTAFALMAAYDINNNIVENATADFEAEERKFEAGEGYQ